MDARRFPTEPWNGDSENAGAASDRLIVVSGKAVSFGYFSLGQQRKVTRLQAEALDSAHKCASKIKGFRLTASDFC